MNGLDLNAIVLLTSIPFVIGCVGGLLVGALNQKQGTRLALACALLGSVMAFASACAFWLGNQAPPLEQEGLPLVQNLIGEFPPLTLTFYVDGLAAFFVLLTGLLSTGVALYSFAWLANRRKSHRIAAVYNLFVLAALLLVVINNVYFFLVFLECITLAFGYLTLYRHNVLIEKEEQDTDPTALEDAKRAFKVYLIASHAGVVFCTAALILLALEAGDASFDALRGLDLAGQPVMANIIFVLALAGFGIKAALSPFQSWMGLTHPYLPTNVHALVSSIIIKVAGIYGLLRVLFDFMDSVTWAQASWWGWLILLLAGLTALTGVFYAITSRDLKTALANHSVENIGIIVAGIGLAHLLSVSDLPRSLASLALVASLYHLLNHAVFKGLLFLSTGAIEDRTGTVELEELGGLIHRFPWTATSFLIGAVAIAGFPPLNGFVSEWLTVQALFASQDLFAANAWMIVGLFGALLMLGTSFGLTALAFVKISGEALLGLPRKPAVPAEKERGDVPWLMRGVLITLAILCLILGLFPGPVASTLATIAQGLLHAGQPLALGTEATALHLEVELARPQAPVYTAHLSMLPFLALLAPPLVLGAWIGLRRRRASRGALWSCGTVYDPASMQITGGAFAFSIWEWASKRRHVSPPNAEKVPWRLPLSSDYQVSEFFRRIINRLVQRLVGAADDFGTAFQGGDIRQYLAYLFTIFVLILLISVLWQGG